MPCQSGDFSIAGNFTNDGLLFVSLGTLTIEGSLTNFDPATRTLTDGAYLLDGSAGQARLVFPGADIVNNAGVIQMNDGSKILDENGNDGLRNFAHNLPARFVRSAQLRWFHRNL